MKRLDLIASLLKGYDVAVDIGSDHGYVLKYAGDAVISFFPDRVNNKKKY